MSKVDAQRAMRETRLAQLEAQAAGAVRGARSPSRSSSTAPPASPPAPAPRASAATRSAGHSAARKSAAVESGPLESGPAAETDDVCGHRSMGNKRCQRPAGHAEKNHRYK